LNEIIIYFILNFIKNLRTKRSKKKFKNSIFHDRHRHRNGVEKTWTFKGSGRGFEDYLDTGGTGGGGGGGTLVFIAAA